MGNRAMGRGLFSLQLIVEALSLTEVAFSHLNCFTEDVVEGKFMTFWVGNEMFLLAIHDRCLILGEIDEKVSTNLVFANIFLEQPCHHVCI